MKRISNPLSKFKIKEIHKEYIDKRLTQHLIDFHKWVSSYNYVQSGVALKLFLPNQKIVEETYNIFLYANKVDQRNFSQDKKKIFEFLSNGFKTKKETISKFKDKTTLLKTLIKNKLVFESKKKDEIANPISLNQLNLKELSAMQDKAYMEIKDKIAKKNKKPIFLDGVTGSGKTEIYFQLIRDYLKKKKTNFNFTSRNSFK